MRDYSLTCCAKPSLVSSKFCIWNDIVKDYIMLCKRYSKVTTKVQRSRLCVLAEPKHFEPKYEEKCTCQYVANCKVQIVDKTDKMASTRTEQLALPKPRYISGLKQQQPFENFSDDRKSDVNRLLRKSLLSVYSRLMNVQYETKESKPKKLDSNTKSKLMKNLEKLSTPKKDYSLVKPKKSGRDKNTPTLRRIRKLSKPKNTFATDEENKWKLTDALKHYKPTERLLNISKPKNYEQLQYIEPFRVQPYVLTYKATPRIKRLATPHKYEPYRKEQKKSPFQINPLALKSVASKRILELASPRDYNDTINRSNPYKVSSAALKAKTTARIRKLAEPRNRILKKQQ